MIQKLEHCVRGTDYGCGGASFSEVIDKVNEVIDYINSRPEETNEAASTMAPSCWGEEQGTVELVNDLEEEVKRYYSDNFTYISSDQPTLSILTNIARHFTEWQKERMTKDAKEIITIQGSLTEPEFVKQRVIFLKED